MEPPLSLPLSLSCSLMPHLSPSPYDNVPLTLTDHGCPSLQYSRFLVRICSQGLMVMMELGYYAPSDR